MDGLWAMTVAEKELQGFGAGVLVATGGSIMGGDNGYFWTGQLDRIEGGVSGTLEVHKYIATAQCIFPPMQDRDSYSMKLEGGYDPARFWATATVVERPELSATVELRRVA